MNGTGKRVLSYAISAVAYGVLAAGTAAGWEMPWFGTVSIAIGGLLSTFFGIEWIAPSRGVDRRPG